MTDEMSFTDHLMELRKALVRSLIGIVVGFAIVYGFAEEVFEWLMMPLCKAFRDRDCSLITIGVAESFLTYLKTGIMGGLFLAAPWIFFQVWSFISPGLHPKERKLVIPFVLSASIMFVGGALFGYFFVFPLAFDFFFSLGGESIVPSPSMEAYFSFSSRLLLAFGALFLTPVIIVLLNFVGVVHSSSLWRSWRYGVIGIFGVAAVLTPADPITMLLLGVPLSVLFVLSLVLCSLIDRGRGKKPPDQAP